MDESRIFRLKLREWVDGGVFKKASPCPILKCRGRMDGEKPGRDEERMRVQLYSF